MTKPRITLAYLRASQADAEARLRAHTCRGAKGCRQCRQLALLIRTTRDWIAEKQAKAKA